MKLTQYASAEAFIAAAFPFLQKEEALNNLPIGIALRLQDNRPYSNESPFLATIVDNGVICLTCVMTPPHAPIIYAEDVTNPAPLERLAQHFISSKISIPSIAGPATLCEAFANIWKSLSGQSGTLRWDQCIYQIDRVNPLPSCEGHGIVATPEYASIIADFSNAFQDEIGLEGNARANPKNVLTSIMEGRNFLWLDANGRVASSCHNNRNTPCGSVVSTVYTPPEYRKRGFASSVVAFASEILLQGGRDYCCLYTDLANPTSNKIYQQIGYHPIGHAQVIEFSH